MIVAGIDVGAKNVHAVLIEDGRVMARAAVASGFDHEESAERGLRRSRARGGVERDAIGADRGHRSRAQSPCLARQQPTEVAADGKGAAALRPGARTVVDVGQTRPGPSG